MDYELNEVYDFKTEFGSIIQIKIIGEFHGYVCYAEHECGHSVIDVKFMKIEEMQNGLVGKSEYDEFEWIGKITPFDMMDVICFAIESD